MSQPYTDDDMLNNLVATGALFMILASSDNPGLTDVTIAEGEDEPGNAILVSLDFLASRYRLTVERVIEE